MSNHLHTLYQQTLAKYKKYHSRFSRGIKSGLYYQYSEKKQARILQRIKKLKQRLSSLKLQLKLAIASGTLALALHGAPANAQELGPFVENEAANPLRQPLVTGDNKSPTLVDIDGDGDLDLFVGMGTGEIRYFENIGFATAPKYIERTGGDNPLDGEDMGDMAAPFFADMDGDGDMDLIAGHRDAYMSASELRYYRNEDIETNGFIGSPTFTLLIGAGNNPVFIPKGQEFDAHPTFVDIDNDGNMDAYVGHDAGPGSSYRSLSFYRYDPVGSSFGFESLSPGLSTFETDFSAQNIAPTFIDLDEDGDFDLVTGSSYGTLRYFENTDDANGTIGDDFDFTEHFSIGNPFAMIDVGYNSVPVFADLDGDGDKDLIIGSGEADVPLAYYKNEGGVFVEQISLDNPFNGVDVGYYATPEFVDINNNGHFDAFIGGKDASPSSGFVNFYENNDDGTFSEKTGADNPLDGLNPSDYQHASFVNVNPDVDNDFDLFLDINNYVLYFENTGTPEAISLAPADSNMIVGYNFPYSDSYKTSFADIDRDGDVDAVLGFYYTSVPSLLMYYKNTGDNTTPVFTEEPADNPFPSMTDTEVSSRPDPNFVDIDHDGYDDLFVGKADGSIVFFPNTGPESFDTSLNPLANPFDDIDVGDNASVAFADIDEDGDLDAFIGNYDGYISYFENQNEVPQINPNVSTRTFTEGSSAIILAIGLELTDDGNDDILSATVAITANHMPGADVLSFTPQGGVTGSFNSSTGVLSLRGYASIATYQDVLRSVTFRNTSQDPSTANRTIEFSAIDFDATIPTTTSSMQVQVNAVNDSPTITTSSESVTYTENDPGVVIDPNISVTDVDNSNLSGATATITNVISTEDMLDFTNQNGITGSYDVSSGILTLSGTASISNYQIALRSITYLNSSDDPDVNDRIISFAANDGTDTSALATRNVIVTPVNDPPVITTSPGNSSFTEGDPATPIDPALVLTDPDNNSLTGATIAITSNHISTEDTLAFTDQNGISGSYDATSGILTLSGTAIVADYEAVLRSVAYRNTSNAPDTNERTISFVATDGTDGGNEATKLLSVISVNEIPEITSANSGVNLVYDLDNSPTILDDLLDVSDTDDTQLESARIAVAGYQSGDLLLFEDQNGIAGTFDAQTGALSLAGSASVGNYVAALRSISFETSNSSGQRQAVFLVNDGDDNSIPYTRSIIIDVNQPPEVDTSPEAVQKGSVITIDLCSIITDPDNTFDELNISVVSIQSGAETSIDGCTLTIDHTDTDFTGQDEIIIKACDPFEACDQNNINFPVEDPANLPLTIYNAVSPNNDNSNDWWEIINLVPPNRIELYNRWGDLVKTLNDYEGETSNDFLSDLPAGTYFYKLQSIQGNYTGYLVIKK